MNIEDFEYLSEAEVAVMAGKVREVLVEALEDLHATRLTYLTMEHSPRKERGNMLGRIDGIADVENLLISLGHYPETVAEMVELHEEVEESIAGARRVVETAKESTWEFWGGYRASLVAFQTSLEEAMETEEGEPIWTSL